MTSDHAIKSTGNNMSKLMLALSVVAALGLSVNCAAQTGGRDAAAPPLSHEGLEAARRSADAQYELDRDGCKVLSDNAREVCVVQARGKEKITRAEAEAAHENTAHSRYEARLVHARVDYEVSMERCGDFAGHRKDVCKADANAELIRARENARHEGQSSMQESPADPTQASALREESRQ
jgi:hypothetical protein